MAYIYCADIYCTACGNRIKEWLDKAGQTPENPKDETTFDSDDYPKWCDDDEESDIPQHCGSHGDCVDAITLADRNRIGCLIGTNLTQYGVEYLKDAIANNRDNEVTRFWAKEFSDYL